MASNWVLKCYPREDINIQLSLSKDQYLFSHYVSPKILESARKEQKNHTNPLKKMR